MDTNDELYKAGLLLHGHKCPAMPMGLRAGLAALEALGVERATDGQLTALVEIDRDHCATCYADGVQMATGCTFGKGNIQKSWACVCHMDEKKAQRVFARRCVSETVHHQTQMPCTGAGLQSDTGLPHWSDPLRGGRPGAAGRQDHF